MGLLNASATTPEDFAAKHGHALSEGEVVQFAFKTVRDFIAFTSWRVLHIDVQGITGSKVEYLTVPYRSINAFAITSAGTLDLDAEIKIFLSGHPPIEFRIARGSDTRGLQGWLASKLDR
jgi:hypothetical protein